MNKKIFFAIIATAIVSSLATSRGRFLYHKILLHNIKKDRDYSVSESSKTKNSNSIYEVLSPSLQNESATKSLKNNSIAFSGTLEEVQKYFEAQGLTDGLPITPPTKELVSQFYKYTPYSPNAVLGKIPPADRQIMTKHVAVVGTMAGCPPEYMPILVAWTKAMSNDDFRKVLSNTEAWTPFLWMNGPIARQLKIDSGQGAISSSNNKKIARFIELAMLNFGGSDAHKNRIGTFGSVSSWTMAEDEEALARIGWQPHHVKQGFNVNDSTITIASSWNFGNSLTPATSDPDKILELIAWDAVEKEHCALGSGMPYINRTIFMTESIAKELARKYKDKNALEIALIQLARRPLEERTYANYWANPESSFDSNNYSIEQHKSKMAVDEKAEWASTPKWLSWIQQDKIQTVPVITSGKTAMVIMGDAKKNKVLTVPGGGITTIKIELPYNWNLLVKKLGYKEITTYYIKVLEIKYPTKTTTIIKKNVPIQQKNTTKVFIRPNGQHSNKQQYKRVVPSKKTTKQYKTVRRVRRIRIF